LSANLSSLIMVLMSSSRKKIGLALSVGGAKGFFHVGVLKALKQANIPIDFIAGSSAGALIGGAYLALNGNIDQLEKIVNHVSYRQLFRIFFDPSTRGGIIKGKKIIDFLNKFINPTKIENLKIPFVAISTDLFTGEPYLFSKGDLASAIRASCSIPFIFSPVEFDNRLLVDGGVSMPIPVSIVRQMGADIVIASNIHSNYISTTRQARPRGHTVVTASIATLMHQLSKHDAKNADLIISPHLKSNPILNFPATKNLITQGESLTKKIIPQIKKLL